jgi:hypothetical protein
LPGMHKALSLISSTVETKMKQRVKKTERTKSGHLSYFPYRAGIGKQNK